MRKALVAITCVVLFTGCSLNKAFVKSVNDYTVTILPEYKEYIENDPNLDKDTKRIRKQTADKFQALVNDAMEEASNE